MAYIQKMAEAQKIRDRQMRKIRSVNCTNENRIREIIKFAKSIIRDLENYGPAGVLHMPILSNIIRKNIKILNPNGKINRIIGNEKADDTVEVEYHPYSKYIGHWTLRSGKEPDNIKKDLNSCLFSVIGSQTGQNPSDLRKWTVMKLKSNLRKFANLVDKIIRLEGNNGVTLMVGGACYGGTSAEDAREILDNSQNRPCHGLRGSIGHPRGHASCPESEDCVETFSLRSRKTAFLSREDQDACAHYVLRTHQAQSAMCLLNRGAIKEVVNLSASYLNISLQARWYRNGIPNKIQNIQNLLIVLCHHVNEFHNPDADVFVLTFYPKVD